MNFNNNNKKLVAICKSKRVFINRNIKEKKAKFKGDSEGHDYYYIDNIPLMSQSCMIYWLTLGNFQFDVRDMRKLGKFKKTVYKADKDFHNPFAQLRLVAKQLEILAQKGILDKVLESVKIPVRTN